MENKIGQQSLLTILLISLILGLISTASHSALKPSKLLEKLKIFGTKKTTSTEQFEYKYNKFYDKEILKLYLNEVYGDYKIFAYSSNGEVFGGSTQQKIDTLQKGEITSPTGGKIDQVLIKH